MFFVYILSHLVHLSPCHVWLPLTAIYVIEGYDCWFVWIYKREWKVGHSFGYSFCLYHILFLYPMSCVVTSDGDLYDRVIWVLMCMNYFCRESMSLLFPWVVPVFIYTLYLLLTSISQNHIWYLDKGRLMKDWFLWLGPKWSPNTCKGRDVRSRYRWTPLLAFWWFTMIRMVVHTHLLSCHISSLVDGRLPYGLAGSLWAIAWEDAPLY